MGLLSQESTVCKCKTKSQTSGFLTGIYFPGKHFLNRHFLSISLSLLWLGWSVPDVLLKSAPASWKLLSNFRFLLLFHRYLCLKPTLSTPLTQRCAVAKALHQPTPKFFWYTCNFILDPCHLLSALFILANLFPESYWRMTEGWDAAPSLIRMVALCVLETSAPSYDNTP